MTIQDIAEAIKFNAYDIALEIKEAEEAISKEDNERTKDFQRAAAYNNILDLICGGDQE